MMVKGERGGFKYRGVGAGNSKWGWGDGHRRRGEGSRGITLSERWMCRWRRARCEGGGENKEGYLTGQGRRGQEGVKRSNKRFV